MNPVKIYNAVFIEYLCSIISGKKFMNTVLSKTPTDMLNKNNNNFSDGFFFINKGSATIIEINDTIITLIIA